MSAEGYQLLRGLDDSEAELSLPVPSPTRMLQSRKLFTKIVSPILLLSILINFFAAFHFLQLESSEQCLDVSPYGTHKSLVVC